MRIAILGAGFAGLSSAIHLAEMNKSAIISVFDKDPWYGYRASGRNAGLLRSFSPDESSTLLSVQAIAYLKQRLKEWGRLGILSHHGSILLGDEKLFENSKRALSLIPMQRELTTEDIAALPLKKGLVSKFGFQFPEDGYLDPHVYLGVLFERAKELGVHFFFNSFVEGLETKGVHVQGIRVRETFKPFDIVVCANGSLAGSFAGGSGWTFRSLKRHIAILQTSLDSFPKEIAYLWDLSRNFYLRKDQDCLLFCICDEAPSDPWDEAVKPRVLEEVQLKAKELLSLSSLPSISYAWAGLRTFASNHQPLIGRDPKLSGFFWVAGLGGHGLTLSMWAGARLAEALKGNGPFGIGESEHRERTKVHSMDDLGTS